MFYDHASHEKILLPRPEDWLRLRNFFCAVPQIGFMVAASTSCAGNIHNTKNNRLDDSGFQDCDTKSTNGWFKMFLEGPSLVGQVRFYTPESGG